MSLFRKPKKNIRSRIEADDEEKIGEEVDDGLDEIHLNINKLKEKKKEKKNKDKDAKPKEKKSTLLSFDDEELEENVPEFKVKKSKESRRLIKLRDKEKKDDDKNGGKHNDDVKIVDDSKNSIKIIDDDIGIVLKVCLVDGFKIYFISKILG